MVIRQKRLGKMVEHRNQRQPNPGLRSLGTPCTVSAQSGLASYTNHNWPPASVMVLSRKLQKCITSAQREADVYSDNLTPLPFATWQQHLSPNHLPLHYQVNLFKNVSKFQWIFKSCHIRPLSCTTANFNAIFRRRRYKIATPTKKSYALLWFAFVHVSISTQLNFLQPFLKRWKERRGFRPMFNFRRLSIIFRQRSHAEG